MNFKLISEFILLNKKFSLLSFFLLPTLFSCTILNDNLLSEILQQKHTYNNIIEQLVSLQIFLNLSNDPRFIDLFISIKPTFLLYGLVYQYHFCIFSFLVLFLYVYAPKKFQMFWYKNFNPVVLSYSLNFIILLFSFLVLKELACWVHYQQILVTLQAAVLNVSNLLENLNSLFMDQAESHVSFKTNQTEVSSKWIWLAGSLTILSVTIFKIYFL